MVIGEKGRAQLQRDQAAHIKETIADVGKLRITFAQARALQPCFPSSTKTTIHTQKAMPHGTHLVVLYHPPTDHCRVTIGPPLRIGRGGRR